MEFGMIQWSIAAAGALLIGMAKTGLPGVGILAVPLMAMILPAKESTGIVLPMLIFADVFAVAYYRRHAVWGHILRLIPWALAGIIAGYLVMDRISNEQLKPIIGIIVLAMLGLNYLRQRKGGEMNVPNQWWFAAAMGLTAGVTTMLANAAGPIMIIYLLAMRLEKKEFIGTGAWYFLILNWVKVPFSMDLGLINAGSLKFNLMLFPFVLIGVGVGIFLLRKMPEKVFNVAVVTLAVASALNMLW